MGSQKRKNLLCTRLQIKGRKPARQKKKEGAIPATTYAVDCRSHRSPPPEELSVSRNEVIVRIWSELSSNIDGRQEKKISLFLWPFNRPSGSRLVDSPRRYLSVCRPVRPKCLAVATPLPPACRTPDIHNIRILSAKGNQIAQDSCTAA